MPCNLGYIRVSTTDQNTDRQLSDVMPSIDRIYAEKVSGKNAKREELQRLMNEAQSGDILHVHSIDRLARNLQDLLFILTDLTSMSVTVRFHKENLTFSPTNADPFQELYLQIIGAVAQFERSMIKERQREGIAKAKSDPNKHLGRPKSLPCDKIKSMSYRGMKPQAIARSLNISRSSVYRVLKN